MTKLDKIYVTHDGAVIPYELQSEIERCIYPVLDTIKTWDRSRQELLLRALGKEGAAWGLAELTEDEEKILEDANARLIEVLPEDVKYYPQLICALALEGPMTNNDPRQWTATQWLAWAREKAACMGAIEWLKSLPQESKPWSGARSEWRQWVIRRLPLEQLHLMIQDPDGRVRVQIARLLPVEHLTQMIGDPDAGVGEAVARRLPEGQLYMMLGNPDARVRYAVAERLPAEQLHLMLGDPIWWVRAVVDKRLQREGSNG